jgi:hypothetical protein
VRLRLDIANLLATAIDLPPSCFFAVSPRQRIVSCVSPGWHPLDLRV